mmetsp:Transcript_25161/g.69145  ORF Transcript_25161/g.69145 Transcript_25161/m.69145 type:complete len:349 (+) Transcript_25161:206-1252(+)
MRLLGVAAKVKLHEDLPHLDACIQPLPVCGPLAALAINLENVDGSPSVAEVSDDLLNGLGPVACAIPDLDAMVSDVLGRRSLWAHVEGVNLAMRGNPVLHGHLKAELVVAADRVHEAGLTAGFLLRHRTRVADPLSSVSNSTKTLQKLAMERGLIVYLKPLAACDSSLFSQMVVFQLQLHLLAVYPLALHPKFVRLADETKGFLLGEDGFLRLAGLGFCGLGRLGFCGLGGLGFCGLWALGFCGLGGGWASAAWGEARLLRLAEATPLWLGSRALGSFDYCQQLRSAEQMNRSHRHQSQERSHQQKHPAACWTPSVGHSGASVQLAGRHAAAGQPEGERSAVTPKHNA